MPLTPTAFFPLNPAAAPPTLLFTVVTGLETVLETVPETVPETILAVVEAVFVATTVFGAVLLDDRDTGFDIQAAAFSARGAEEVALEERRVTLGPFAAAAARLEVTFASSPPPADDRGLPPDDALVARVVPVDAAVAAFFCLNSCSLCCIGPYMYKYHTIM